MMNKRELSILDIVAEHDEIEVSKLAQMLDVSQVTIRKDLDLLENKGLLKREHGYARIASKDDINSRIAVKYDLKQRIAIAAAKLVENNETIMIESGSSCSLLASYLAQNKQGVTIITNSAFIASYIRKYNGAKIILLGGEYQNESQVVVGPLVGKCLDSFFVDKLFIGTDGFSEEGYFTGNDLARTQAVRDMADRCKKVIILTDSSKFDRQGVVTLLPADSVNTVVTDENISPNIQKKLEKFGIDIIKVGV